MKRLTIALLLSAGASSLMAQTLPQRQQSTYVAGPNVACTNTDGSPTRCVLTGATLYDTTGAALGTNANPLYVSGGTGGGGGSVPTGTAGSPNANVVTVQGISGGTPQNIAASSLPLPTGAATAAKQPTLGTAGTASTDVITVQGIAGGTPQNIAGSVNDFGLVATTSPTLTNGATAQLSLTTAGAVRTDSSATTQPVAISATGVGGSSGNPLYVSGAGGTSSAVAQGSTTSGQSGQLDQFAVTTAAPTYTTGTTNPFSGTVAGALRVDATGTTQPVTGATAQGTTYSANPLGTGCYGSATVPTAVTAGQIQRTWCNLNGVTVSSPGPGSSQAMADAASNTLIYETDPNGNQQALKTQAFGMVYNGTTWDRAPGSTIGASTISKGGANLNTGQVSVATTATQIVAARTGRQKIIISKQGANNCAFGGSGVTLTTGYINDNSASPVAGSGFTWDTAAAVYGICSVATTVTFVEQY